MAYTIPTYTTDTEIDVTNAFAVMNHLLYRAGTDKDRAVYWVYKSAAHYAVKPEKPIGRITVMFDIAPAGTNFILQANAALLLLPEMAGAVQV